MWYLSPQYLSAWRRSIAKKGATRVGIASATTRSASVAKSTTPLAIETSMSASCHVRVIMSKGMRSVSRGSVAQQQAVEQRVLPLCFAHLLRAVLDGSKNSDSARPRHQRHRGVERNERVVEQAARQVAQQERVLLGHTSFSKMDATRPRRGQRVRHSSESTPQSSAAQSATPKR